jgi:hypothetical protein
MREVVGYGSEDHYRSEGEEREGSRLFKIAQGIENESDPLHRIHLR